MRILYQWCHFRMELFYDDEWEWIIKNNKLCTWNEIKDNKDIVHEGSKKDMIYNWATTASAIVKNGN